MARIPFKQDPPVDYVQRRLEEIGLGSEKVEEVPNQKTCDLRAWTKANPSERFWIEVKTKATDKSLKAALRGEKLERPLDHAKKVDGGKPADTLSDAVSQLKAMADKEDGFEIAWFLASSPLTGELDFRQAIAGVFGIQIVTELPVSSMKPCYFFDESLFFTFKRLDAVILEKSHAFKMCLNPYALRLQRFRETKLFTFFDTRGDVIDPFEEEKAGHAYVADCKFDRRTQQKDVLAFLGEKYGLKEPVNFVFWHQGPYGVVIAKRRVEAALALARRSA